MAKKSTKSKNGNPVERWHKTYIKRIRQRFGLSQYQMLWLTFGKGLAVGYAMAFILHR